jgi:hypothetical protein
MTGFENSNKRKGSAMAYGKSGLDYRPTTAEEASGRNPNQKLHDKLLAIRNGKQGRWGKPNTSGKNVLTLVSDIILNLAFAADKDTLNFAARQLFERMSRSEILCWLCEEARYTFRLNQEQYGNNPKGEPIKTECGYTRGHTNLEQIQRLTREMITEKYGAEDWHSRYRPYNKVYISDVKYGRFLREHGLSHRLGGQITEADLPPINLSALSGNDVLAKREMMIRLTCKM